MTQSPILNRYTLGDMEVIYLRDDAGHIGMCMIPAHMEEAPAQWAGRMDHLVQLHVRGDALAGAAANGHTLCGTQTSQRFCYRDQAVESADGATVIRTTLSDDRDHRVIHLVTHKQGARAISIRTIFENGGDAPITLEN